MTVFFEGKSFIMCSVCATKKSGLSQDDQAKGIKKVNKSIGWEDYDGTIQRIIKESGKNLLLTVHEGQISAIGAKLA